MGFGYVIYIVIGLFTVDIRENYQYALEKYNTWMQVTTTYAKFGDAEESQETTQLDTTTVDAAADADTTAEETGGEAGSELRRRSVSSGGSPAARKGRNSFVAMDAAIYMDHLRMDNISRFLDTIALSKSEIERVDFM